MGLALSWSLLIVMASGMISSQPSECYDEQEEPLELSDEKRLIRRLLNNYENAGIIGRPVQNTSDKVVIEFELALIQILNLDEKNQILTINAWPRYNWIDQLLRWEPANYSYVTQIRVPPEKVWTPDIVLYNYADERMKEQRDVMVVVESNGKVLWIPPAIYKSSCKIDIINFPFDQQACRLKFGSWTYDGFKLDLQFYMNISEVTLADYTPSNEWDIVARPARRNVKYYLCCPEPYPDLTFFLFLRRNPAFFAYLLVFPCVLLSSLTLVIFWLPPESPAKMVLGMNIFVAFFLLLLLLADSTPSASTSVPYIGYYYCLNMVLITLSTFLSVIVINLYFRGDKQNTIPDWLRKTVHVLSQLLCMNQELNSKGETERLRVIKSEIKISKKHKEKQTTRKKKPGPATRITTNNTAATAKPEEIRLKDHFSSNANCINSSTAHMNNITSAVMPPFYPAYPVPYSPAGQPIRYFFQNGQLMMTPVNPEEISFTSPPNAQYPHCSSGSTVDDSGTNAQKSYFAQGNSIPTNSIMTPGKISAAQANQILQSDLREIRRSVRTLMNRIADKDSVNRIAREWRMVALVLDRIFFWCYLWVIIIAGLTLLLPKDPQKTIEEVILEYTPQAATTEPPAVQISPKI